MIRTLTADDFESLYAAFAEAFSDYIVKFTPTREQLLEMFTRRGWVPSLSVGAFDEERMVAFTVNALDGDRAYDSGTGVVPSHRRHGLARTLMERSFELLAPHASEYVLEVIDGNTKAQELYRRCGFIETRGLQCWSYEESGLRRRQSPLLLPSGAEPAWQNTMSSVRRARDPHLTLGDEHGFVIVFPSNGDVPQLFVRPEARRQGIGTKLLQSAAAAAGKPLRIMNVDERDQGMAAFLEHIGAKRTVRQIEMVRRLH